MIRRQLDTRTADNALYFGCRSATKDQHYASEWATFAKEGKLSYRVACSRDGPEGVKRTYVQDLIESDTSQIWRLIGEHNAYVYISGCVRFFPCCDG